MRPGELFGLTWSDIDFASSRVQVLRSLEEINGKHRIKEVKTQKRSIGLTPQTMDALTSHRAGMLKEGRNVKTGIVFCDTDGGYLRISNFHRGSFKPIIRAAKLPDIRLYDLRHTCATLLLLAGESPKVVGERLGHAGIQLTLDTYSHVLPSMQQRAADTLGKIFAAGNAKAKKA